MVAAEEQGAIPTLRRLFQLTRGQTLRLFGLAMALVLVMLVSSMAISAAGGSLLLLLGKVTGLKALALLLADVLAALVASMVALLSTVAGVVVYRKLA